MRSATRKRGARGQGGKAKSKKKVTKNPVAVVMRPSVLPAAPLLVLPAALLSSHAAISAPTQPAGLMHLGVEMAMTPQSPPKKRKRERKNRHWKPWSEQTWEERLEREKYQERRAAEREAQEAMPLSKNEKKKRKRNNEFVIPRAPRNTTQALMHVNPTMSEDGQHGDLAPSPMTSMQGLLSRSSFAHQEDRGESESSDSDENDAGPRVVRRTNGVAKAAERPPSPQSPHSPPGTPGSPLRQAGAGVEAAMGEDVSVMLEEKDQRIRELEAQNESLRARLEALENNMKAQA